MIPRRSSEEWMKRTELAKACKGLIDILLSHYDPKIYEDMVLVARLDGGQIPLKHQRKIGKYLKMPPGEGGSLRIEHKLKVVVSEQCQQVKGMSRMVSDFHDRIP